MTNPTIDLSHIPRLRHGDVHRLDQVCLPIPPYTPLTITDSTCSGAWVDGKLHMAREFARAGYCSYAAVKRELDKAKGR